MIVTDSLRLVLIGVVVGIPLAYGAARVSGNILNLVADDPAVFVGIVLVIMIVGTIAGWLPARAAARVDPVSVLRAR